jgi:hypothetical protein
MQQFPGATAAIIRGEGREQQRLLWPSFAERQAQWEAENPNDPPHNSDNESDIEMISSSAQGLLCASDKGMGKGCKGKGLRKGEDEGNFNSASGQGQGEVVLASDQLDAERQAPADAELNELIWVHHQAAVVASPEQAAGACGQPTWVLRAAGADFAAAQFDDVVGPGAPLGVAVVR